MQSIILEEIVSDTGRTYRQRTGRSCGAVHLIFRRIFREKDFLIFMKRQLWIPVIGVLIGSLALLAHKNTGGENGFTLPGYHNADAKFLGDQVLTSVDEGIRLLDLAGNVVQQYDGLQASWLYVQEIRGEEESGYAAVYSNHANETHILKLTEEGAFLQDRTVLRSDTLAIDPILLQDGDTWYLTHTWIDGTVNNPTLPGRTGPIR